MVVTAKGNGRDVVGLRVGAANARRYFSRELDNVELRMGDLRIECRLPPEFWSTRPEIHDPRLCEWLKYKASQLQSRRQPIALAMEQTGENSFTLHPISMHRRGKGFAAA